MLIGPIPPPVGGATCAFAQLQQELSGQAGVVVTTVNTSRNSPGVLASALHSLRVLSKVVGRARSVDVLTFHASIRGAFLFGPIVRLVALVARRRWVFRGFGGYFFEWYSSSGKFRQFIFRNTVMKADAVLFETLSSVRSFRRTFNRPVQWFPNSRSCPRSQAKPALSRSGARRFVYLGQVRLQKGLSEIMEAATLLGPDIQVDIYGPLMDGHNSDEFARAHVRYRGVIDPDRVGETLKNYDVLLFPTHCRTEGYPGAILEAFCAGVPVIASRLGGIPEIVTTSSGILIDPEDSVQLAEAMRGLFESPHRLRELSQGAFVAARRFKSATWAKAFLRTSADVAKIPV